MRTPTPLPHLRCSNVPVIDMFPLSTKPLYDGTAKHSTFVITGNKM